MECYVRDIFDTFQSMNTCMRSHNMSFLWFLGGCSLGGAAKAIRVSSFPQKGVPFGVIFGRCCSLRALMEKKVCVLNVSVLETFLKSLFSKPDACNLCSRLDGSAVFRFHRILVLGCILGSNVDVKASLTSF